MVRQILFSLLIGIVLTGCVTSRGSFCEISSPVRLSDAAIDALTDAQVNRILAHNEKGAALCGWKVDP